MVFVERRHPVALVLLPELIEEGDIVSLQDRVSQLASKHRSGNAYLRGKISRELEAVVKAVTASSAKAALVNNRSCHFAVRPALTA